MYCDRLINVSKVVLVKTNGRAVVVVAFVWSTAAKTLYYHYNYI